MFGGDSVIVGATAAEIAKEPATGDPQTSKNYGRIGGAWENIFAIMAPWCS